MTLLVFLQEFDESGDPEKHFQALLSLVKEGIEKGKVQSYFLFIAGIFIDDLQSVKLLKQYSIDDIRIRMYVPYDFP